MFDLYGVLTSLIVLIAIALGIFLLVNHGKEKQPVLFGVFNILTGIWILANYFGSDSLSLLITVDYICGAFMAYFFWLFSRELRGVSNTESRSAVRRGININIAATVTLGIIILLTVNGHVVNIDQLNGLTNSTYYVIYPVIISLFVFTAIYNLIYSYWHSRERSRKTRIRLILIGLTIASVSIVIPNLLLQNLLPENNFWLNISYNFSTLGILVFLSLSTYAIIRHGLFDIKQTAVRSAAYAGALLTMAGMYYLLAYALSMVAFGGHTTEDVSVSPINIMLALMLAFIFQPIKNFFDRLTNGIFYRQAYSKERFFSEMSVLLSSTVDLRALLERTSLLIAETLKAEKSSIVIYYIKDTRRHLSAGTAGHANIHMADLRLLDAYVSAIGSKILLSDYISDKPHVKRILHSAKVALVMPLRQHGEVAGYVMLGECLSGRYTKRDLTALESISTELEIAIQNAISLHEVKELNATLQQRIDVATKELRSSNAQLKHIDEVKDEFMSMASHQLRTPLTSIKGYLSMVLEGDAGKVTDQQQKLLLEAFKSSERMVGLISDFLDISRLQTGKFLIDKSTFDLKEVVEQEVNDLRQLAESHNIKLKAQLAPGECVVHADVQKIRQVIMNFIDNAIYYSHADSTIVIHLDKTKSAVAFTVVDTGIGVPKEEQARLFNKFYRAKNARVQRPDGTGVGLYLARRVMTGHHGRILFSSKEGKGSTFGFQLPLEKSV